MCVLRPEGAGDPLYAHPLRGCANRDERVLFWFRKKVPLVLSSERIEGRTELRMSGCGYRTIEDDRAVAPSRPDGQHAVDLDRLVQSLETQLSEILGLYVGFRRGHHPPADEYLARYGLGA